MKSKRKIFNEIMVLFKELGYDCLRVFLEKGNREKVKKFCKSLLRKKFVVKVDYKKTVEEKVVGIGYDEVSSYVNSELFPIDDEKKGVVEIEIEAFYLEKGMTPYKAEESLREHGLRPAEFEEFLSFEERNPEIRKQCPVACLGSHLNYGRMCNMWYSYPYSFTEEGKSLLSFTFKDHVFEKGTCIPAVKV